MVRVEPGTISELIASGAFQEGPELEAKLARSNVPTNAWQSICAFANTIGGVLVLGIQEQKNGSLEVEGVADPDRMVQDLHNTMRNTGKISHEVALGGDIWKESIDGKALVIVRVRPTPRRFKPVFLNGMRDLAWVRRNEGDMRCRQDEIDRMVRENNPGSADAEVIPYLKIDDFNWDTVQAYQEFSKRSRPTLPHHQRSGKAYLEALEAWRTDREQQREGPTFAGIMVFGTDTAIQEIRLDHMIDYQRVPSDATPATRWSDRVEWSGNLYGAWETIFPRLVREQPVRFRLEGAQRIDRPDGFDSLREAFVNLLVHTDYRERGDAVIKHRDDGFSFRNPGESRVDTRFLGVEGRSERRNPKIAKIFNLAGLADRAGSGFQRIQDEWRDLGYRRPRVSSDPEEAEFFLELSLAALIPHEDKAWLDSFGEDWKEGEALALWHARHSGSIDNQTLREYTGQHMWDASRTLVALKNRGYLVTQGAGRSTHYILGESAAPIQDDNRAAQSDNRGAQSDIRAAQSDNRGAESDNWAAQSDNWAELVGHVLHPETLRGIVVSLHSAGSPPSGEEMRRAVFRLCTVEALTAHQLEVLLDRRLPTIRKYVRELERTGRLTKAGRVPGTKIVRYVSVSPRGGIQPRLEMPESE